MGAARTVLVVDPCPPVPARMRRWLGPVGDIVLIGDTGTTAEAVEWATTLPPKVALLALAPRERLRL